LQYVFGKQLGKRRVFTRLSMAPQGARLHMAVCLCPVGGKAQPHVRVSASITDFQKWRRLLNMRARLSSVSQTVAVCSTC